MSVHDCYWTHALTVDTMNKVRLFPMRCPVFLGSLRPFWPRSGTLHVQPSQSHRASVTLATAPYVLQQLTAVGSSFCVPWVAILFPSNRLRYKNKLQVKPYRTPRSTNLRMFLHEPPGTLDSELRLNQLSHNAWFIWLNLRVHSSLNRQLNCMEEADV